MNARVGQHFPDLRRVILQIPAFHPEVLYPLAKFSTGWIADMSISAG